MNTSLRTPLLLLACSLTAFGCDAPEKSVGQETEGDPPVETESASETAGCSAGIAACTDSDSDSDSDTDGNTTGGTADCSSIEVQFDCAEAGCDWVTPSTVSLASGTCEISDGSNGYCIGYNNGPEDGCGYTPSCPDEPGFDAWVRQVDDQTWELHTRSDCFEHIPAGFTECVPGSSPEVCDCACATPASLPPGFEMTLGSGGCGDMTVFGATPDGTIGVAMTTGLDFTPVDDALVAGETLTTEHDVSEFARFVVYVGDNVLYPECNDALDKDAYEIQQEWVATAGTVSIEIVPEVDPPKFGTLGFATVTVSGLEVTHAGVTESVGEFSFTDVAVGWLPG